MENIAVVDFRSVKAGALYYDYVLPAFPMLEVTPQVVHEYDEILTKGTSGNLRIAAANMILRHGRSELTFDESLRLVHPSMRKNYELMLFFLWTHVMALLAWHSSPNNNKNAETYKNGIDLSIRNVDGLKESLRLERYPILRSCRDDEFAPLSGGEDIMVELSNMKLIDPNLLSFEQLYAIRQDPLARKQLQKLRTFMRSNLQGKSRAEIEDGLGSSMLDYESAAKSHGAPLAQSAFSALASSVGTLHGLGAALGIGLLAKGDVTSGIGVIAVELAGVTLTIAKSLASRREGLVKHEMAYFNTVKEYSSASTT